LDFAHNAISALAALHECTALRSLDLSHNRLRSLTNAHRVLGNVVRLNLRANGIVCTAGLEKLYALQVRSGWEGVSRERERECVFESE
jgi:Leucine-rich repeat (LRR) protein